MTESCASVPRLVVGYIATDRGRDAISLAISIARSVEIELVVTIVRPESSTFHAAGSIPKDGTGIVAQRLDEWLEEALALIPDDIGARGVIHTASNESKGLMEVASDEGAVAIVIGARATTLMRQFRIGTVATSAAHSSEVPVVLAPAGRSDIGPVSRITTLFGARPGAAALIGSAIEAATAFDVDLRLVALIENDGMAEDEIAEVTEFAEEYGEQCSQHEPLTSSPQVGPPSSPRGRRHRGGGRKRRMDLRRARLHRLVPPGTRSRLHRSPRAPSARVLPVPVVVIPRRTLSRTDDATGADTSARADGDAQAAAGERR